MLCKALVWVFLAAWPAEYMYSLYYPIRSMEYSRAGRNHEQAQMFTIYARFAPSIFSWESCVFFLWLSRKKLFHSVAFHVNTLFVMWLIMQKAPSGNLFVQSVFTTLLHNNLVMRTKQLIIRRLRDTESPQLSKRSRVFRKILATFVIHHLPFFHATSGV